MACCANLSPIPIEDRPTPPPTRTVTRNGTTYEQNTANIGKAKVERFPTAILTPRPATAAENQIPEDHDTPKDTPTAAADDELGALRAENAALREELDDVKASFADTLADNETMGKVIDADDKLKTAMDEVKRLQAVADSAERTLRAKSGECAEAIRSAKSWKNRAEKAERLLAKAA